MLTAWSSQILKRKGTVSPHVFFLILWRDGCKPHNQDHSSFEAASHGGKTSLALEGVGVTEKSLLVSAEVLSNRVVLGESIDGSNRVVDDCAVLDIEATDLDEFTTVSVVAGNELDKSRAIRDRIYEKGENSNTPE